MLAECDEEQKTLTELYANLLEKQFETFQNVINKKVIVYLKDFISKSHLLKLLKWLLVLSSIATRWCSESM